MFFPDLRTVEDIYKSVEQLTQENEQIFRRWGFAIDPLDYPNILYEPERSGLNVYANVEDVLARGRADCEDFTAWMNAFLRFSGRQAETLALQQTDTLWHIVSLVKINNRWAIIDLSKMKGMPY